MSEYTPSRQELIAAWIQSHQEEGWLGGPVDIGGRPKERIAEAHRGLAEVERDAAEKGYGAGIRDAEQFYQSHTPAYGKAPLPMPVNPYRRHEGESE